MRVTFVIAALLLAAEPARPQSILQLQAEEIARFPAREAGQGAAADADHFFAIVNSAIGKYDRATGKRVAEWKMPSSGPIRHLNSCIIDAGRLMCANSNFPEVPMASSIESFDAGTLEHAESHSLGLTDGSLVWFDRLGDGWIAGFAHYDGEGGVAFKDHRYMRIARYDSEWIETGGWTIPESVRERLAPHSASGGGIGPDGLLYLTGHDREEMYVLDFPTMGPALVHLATIHVGLQGQAFAWDRSGDRVVWGISRANKEVRAIRVPEVPR